ncbi:neuroguidin-like isoform X2 [Symsagittifera roscoffensis]|uniref:neuroguidin-like isoform X2 n=1 Tax=Symsagittifera roscoffensis TaxID=84072 RepID=UPI00307C2395
MSADYDSTDTNSLLEEKFSKISASLDKVKNQLPDIIAKTSDSQLKNGLSLNQLKNTALIMHNVNLLYLIREKLRGNAIKDSPTVERLIESRVIMERMKPLELKLKYQMERLLKVSNDVKEDNNSSNSRNSALNFRPNLSKLMQRKNASNNDDDENSDDEDEDELDSEIEGDDGDDSEERESRKISQKKGIDRAKEQLRQKKAEKSTGGKYVPPKVVPMPYTQDSEGGRGSKKEEQREFMKRYNSSVMRELREEFSETPQEYSEVPGGAATAAKYRKVEQLMKVRQQHEEEYMTRLPALKSMKKMTQIRGLSEIDRMVGSLSSLNGKGKKRKGAKKSMGGGKRFRKPQKFKSKKR